MKCVVFLMAVVLSFFYFQQLVIVAIEPDPSVQLCLTKGHVVVTRSLESLSSGRCGVSLKFSLLALMDTVVRVISLPTVTAEVLVPLAVLIGGRQHMCPIVKLIYPCIVV